MQLSPFLASPKLACWEDNGMELNIVFAHELIEFHIFWILPPLLPLSASKILAIRVVFRDRNVTYASIEP